MLPEKDLDSAALARQVQQHLESLRWAGVEWLPAPPEPEIFSQAATPTQAAAFPAGTLFSEPAAPVLPVEHRRQALKVLAQEVSGCTRCSELAATRTQTVFGVGAPDVELCFVGEAPGVDEDAQGEPFVGPAGQLLNRILAACGMRRDEVYICNILKCRPPGNRTPLPNEAANCRSFLERQLELIAPRFICCLGACAAQNLLGISTSIGRLRGTFQTYRGIPVFCTYHPAYLLRYPEKKKDVWEDMKLLMARMGRKIPSKGGEK